MREDKPMKKPTILEEFEKAFDKEFGENFTVVHDGAWEASIALWAAQWMAKRCGNIANRIMSEQDDPKCAVVAQKIKLELRSAATQLVKGE